MKHYIYCMVRVVIAKKQQLTLLILLFSLTQYSSLKKQLDPKLTKERFPKPKLVTPYDENRLASSTMVLFDGIALDEWIGKNGVKAYWDTIDIITNKGQTESNVNSDLVNLENEATVTQCNIILQLEKHNENTMHLNRRCCQEKKKA